MFYRLRLVFAMLTCSLISVFAVADPLPSSFAARDHPSRFAVEWMELTRELVRTERLSPPVASRIYAYTGVTLYEAVLPGMPDSLSLSGQLNEMPSMPQVGPSSVFRNPAATRLYRELVPQLAVHLRHHSRTFWGLDWPAVAAVAASHLILGLLPDLSEGSQEAVKRLRLAHLGERASAGVPMRSLRASIFRGVEVAEAILEWAAGDRYAQVRQEPYQVPSGTGLWEPTSTVQTPLEPYWGRLRTFALEEADSCVPPRPVPFSEEPGSDFFSQAYAAYSAVINITSDQLEIVLFWADNPGQTGTPPGHWIAIAGQVVEPLSLETAVEAYALTGIAVADAFIACWSEKFRSNLLRPVTFIQRFIDAGWNTLIPTPPFPEYTSGHSVNSGAASEVLASLFGDVPFTDATHLVGLGLAPRHFSGFPEAAREAAVSRLYAGIHFPMGIENGLSQGRCVATQILTRVKTRKW